MTFAITGRMLREVVTHRRKLAPVIRPPQYSAVLTVLSAMTATALVLRLSGIFRELLPSPGRLALALAALHLLSLSTRPRQFGRWRDFFLEHAFGVGLFAACVIALAVRLPGFANDLGSTPLDIDEHRVAASVRHYFVTGEVRHEHIEQYPGAVFWMFAASSLVAFLRALTNGLVSARNQLPVDAFAEAARLANIWVGVATVAITGLMGVRLSGTTAGLLGAVLVAIVPISVETTVLVRNDAGMVLAVVQPSMPRWSITTKKDSLDRRCRRVRRPCRCDQVHRGVRACAGVVRSVLGRAGAKPDSCRARRSPGIWPGRRYIESLHMGGLPELSGSRVRPVFLHRRRPGHTRRPVTIRPFFIP